MSNENNFPVKMGSLLKAYRIRYNKKAIDLAKYIHKSPAYINKLENGGIKKINESLLKNIIYFITEKEGGIDEFYQEYTNIITNEEYEKQLLIMNYDYNTRLIPVPSPLINFINEKMIANSINSEDVISYINKNEDICDEEYAKEYLKNIDCKYNQWKEIMNEHENGYFICLKYDLNKYNIMLNSKQKKETYMFIYSFLYHLLKIENKNSNNIIDLDKIRYDTNVILNKYRFYSLEAKYKLIADENIDKSRIVTKYDIEFNNAINSLIKNTTYFGDKDILNATEVLGKINRNFDRLNNSFVFDFMSLDLENISKIKDKKTFIKDIQKYINTYSESKADDEDTDY